MAVVLAVGRMELGVAIPRPVHFLRRPLGVGRRSIC